MIPTVRFADTMRRTADHRDQLDLPVDLGARQFDDADRTGKRRAVLGEHGREVGDVVLRLRCVLGVVEADGEDLRGLGNRILQRGIEDAAVGGVDVTSPGGEIVPDVVDRGDRRTEPSVAGLGDVDCQPVSAVDQHSALLENSQTHDRSLPRIAAHRCQEVIGVTVTDLWSTPSYSSVQVIFENMSIRH